MYVNIIDQMKNENLSWGELLQIYCTETQPAIADCAMTVVNEKLSQWDNFYEIKTWGYFPARKIPFDLKKAIVAFDTDGNPTLWDGESLDGVVALLPVPYCRGFVEWELRADGDLVGRRDSLLGIVEMIDPCDEYLFDHLVGTEEEEFFWVDSFIYRKGLVVHVDRLDTRLVC